MTVPAAIAEDESERLAKLHRYAILDSDPEASFDRIVRLAARQFKVPIALISLVDEDRQWFKASCGLNASETGRDVAFCAHAILGDDVFIVPDATKDPRFAKNPLVTGGPEIRFYAGAPLTTPKGHKLGTLCLIDTEPRDGLSAEDQALLTDLAAVVTDQIEMRHASGDVLTEVETRIEAESELGKSRAFLDAVLQNIQDGIVACDADGRLSLFNRASQLFHGLDSKPIPPEEWAAEYDLYEADGETPLDAQDIPLFKALNGDPVEGQEMVIAPHGGKTRRLLAFAMPMFDADGKKLGAVASMHDITEQRLSDQRLQYAANHDSLTGLSNRQAFDNELSRKIVEFDPAQESFHLVLVDLDRFKDVNDFFGHLVGDAVLEEIADRLADCAGQDTLIARWGGDEFVVVTQQGCAVEEANDLAERLIEACSARINIGGHKVSVGATCGVSTFQKGLSARELLRRSDLALYHGKNREPGRAYFYRDEFELEAQRRKKAITSLSVALDEDRVFAGYQPIIELQTGKTIGTEALLRLHNSSGDLLTASKVLPALLDPNLSRVIFDRMLDSICSDYQRLSSALPDLEFISINATEADILSHDFVENFLGKLAAAKIDPRGISLEFTETLLMVNDTSYIRQVLGQLRSQGISIALDDFGTGFSSLTHLRDFPIDKIKIDRSFTNGVTRDQNSLMIVEALASMGHSMSLEVIAEGVENELEREALMQLGCRLGQGYFFSHAESVDRIELETEKLRRAASVG